MPIRSGVLARANSPGAGLLSTLAIVPAGVTWLIKSVSVFNNGAGAGMTGVTLSDPGNVVSTAILDATLGNPEARFISGLWALMPGGSIVITWQSANETVWVTGVVLPGTI